MVSVRSAKAKGSKAEYSTWNSLKPLYPDILICKQLGMVSGYDLIDHKVKVVFEVKHRRSISWNQAKKFYLKLCKNAPEKYTPFLVFLSNQQPALVMCDLFHHGGLTVQTFKEVFGVPFIDHATKRERK